MEKESIELPGASKYGPYSAGVRANGMIWLSGQIAVEAGDDVQAQTQGALDKIDALLGNISIIETQFMLRTSLVSRHQ